MTNPTINLLPWRERQERRGQVTYFVILAMTVVLSFLGAFLLHWEKGREVGRLRSEISGFQRANERIEQIKGEQAQVTSRIVEAEAWLVEYEDFSARRLLFHKLWRELAQHLPDSMHYQSLRLENSKLILTGMTASSPDLATFLRRLEASTVFVAPRLVDLQDAFSGHEFAIAAGLESLAEAA